MLRAEKRAFTAISCNSCNLLVNKFDFSAFEFFPLSPLDVNLNRINFRFDNFQLLLSKVKFGENLTL
jgi:hypothetical protein